MRVCQQKVGRQNQAFSYADGGPVPVQLERDRMCLHYTPARVKMQERAFLVEGTAKAKASGQEDAGARGCRVVGALECDLS